MGPGPASPSCGLNRLTGTEKHIRPWALARSNWLRPGSLRSGQHGAALLTLIRSARLNGHDPHTYLKGVLTRLPTRMAEPTWGHAEIRVKLGHSASKCLICRDYLSAT